MKPPRPKISLLIPFSSKNHVRTRTFKWLLQYWKCELPEAQIVIGHSSGKVFCKGRALNNAAAKARGKVLCILDADAYLPGHIINTCADRILEEIAHHLWYVPYRHLYRLTRKATKEILKSDPCDPLRLPSPPPFEDIDCKGRDHSRYGHRYGAMITIIPRQALKVLGCFDERFKGWGGEDVAILRALDTLYGRHKTTNNDILHLWHPFIGETYQTRRWKGQRYSCGRNSNLAIKYHMATGHPRAMRKLVNQGCKKHKRQARPKQVGKQWPYKNHATGRNMIG
jgi:predicted glycosyltransferase involved in capsule biosynthesis